MTDYCDFDAIPLDDDIDAVAFDPDAVEGLPVIEGPEGPVGPKGDTGIQGPTGEGASDPGDLTLIFDNKLI